MWHGAVERRVSAVDLHGHDQRFLGQQLARRHQARIARCRIDPVALRQRVGVRIAAAGLIAGGHDVNVYSGSVGNYDLDVLQRDEGDVVQRKVQLARPAGQELRNRGGGEIQPHGHLGVERRLQSDRILILDRGRRDDPTVGHQVPCREDA